MGRREQRFRCGPELQVEPQIYEQQTVILIVAEKSQHKSLRAKHCAINPPGAGAGENRIMSPQVQQILVQAINLRVLFSFGEIEFAAPEGFFSLRFCQVRVTIWTGNSLKLMQKLAPAFGNQPGKFRSVIGTK